MKSYQMGLNMAKGIFGLLADEYRRGTLAEFIRLTREKKRPTFSHDLSHAQLLEERAQRRPNRPFLRYHGTKFTYKQMDDNANRVANFLISIGAQPGRAVAVLMGNSPKWLDAFMGVQRMGMCAVPVNTALRGDQLSYIFNHSEAAFAFIDHDLLQYYLNVKDSLDRPPQVIVNTEGAPDEFELPEGMIEMDKAYQASTQKPEAGPREGDPCMLMYTSGTTGRPKGVVTRYGKTGIKMITTMGKVMLRPDDVYFTCLPLFHGNALLLTITTAMGANAQVALYEKFSASRFWDWVRESESTVFNGLGAMIPILMKQPEKPADRDHKVRYVLSAACPADMWAPFQDRFGVEIVEAYGAVDGGGLAIMNWGQAPVGSIGRPLGGVNYRLVDDDMNDVPKGQPGELIAWVGEKESSVEYYKDGKATSEKVRDGWLHTGDLMYEDENRYLYFVGRKTESLRRRGENISAYEVEHGILQHPDVLECAVYAVPSELGEDDVMAAVVPIEGRTIDAKELAEFLKDHLARFAIPRYYRFMNELPKTETQRVIKGVLEKEGVTEDTIDLEPGGKKA